MYPEHQWLQLLDTTSPEHPAIVMWLHTRDSADFHLTTIPEIAVLNIWSITVAPHGGTGRICLR